MAYFVNRLLIFSCAVLLPALAGCSGNMFNSKFSPFGSGQNAAGQAALEGRWVDANGIPSTFHNGIFETRSPDTYEKLSEGNYIFGSNNIVAIEVRSLVRGSVSHVNCALADAKLYCTAENSTKFILTRG